MTWTLPLRGNPVVLAEQDAASLGGGQPLTGLLSLPETDPAATPTWVCYYSLVIRIRQASVVASVLLVPTLLGTSACTTMCAMPSEAPPNVELDTAAWWQTHPAASTMSACLAMQCESVTATQPEAQLGAGTYYERPLPLSVIATEDGRQILQVRSSVLLVKTTTDYGSCGSVTSWSLRVTLNAAGQLVVQK